MCICSLYPILCHVQSALLDEDVIDEILSNLRVASEVRKVFINHFLSLDILKFIHLVSQPHRLETWLAP